MTVRSFYVQLLLSFLLFFPFIKLKAQRCHYEENGIQASLQELTIRICFLSDGIVRVTKAPANALPIPPSLSVTKVAEKVRLQYKRTRNIVAIKSRSLCVQLDVETGNIAFLDNNSGILLREKENGYEFSRAGSMHEMGYRLSQAFHLDSTEIIYGLGQQQDGKMNRRFQNLTLLQENMKICIPFFQSVKGYGLYWDNYSPTKFTDSFQETRLESETGNGIDYYFILGGRGGEGVTMKMRTLTGSVPMLPLWVLGYNQSRERYNTQSEVLQVLNNYRTLKIPIDGIVQDWQYWGKDSNWNAMQFMKDRYPDPKQMVDSIHLLNAHFFIVAWPGFGAKTEQYKVFRQHGFLLNFETYPASGGAVPYDVYNPWARKLYWEYLNKGLFSVGIDGWWLDSSEPDHVNKKEEDFDQTTFLGSLRSVRNAFPLQHVKGVYEHQRQQSKEKRVVMLTRSAFAGQQRYGTILWSGDIHSEWEVLRKQISGGLNLTMCGIPYWNTDIGGFFAGKFPGGAQNPAFQELYTRWLQFATFTPMMRSHGTSIPREIYQFGKRGEKTFDVIEKFIKLRYRLLPYLYSIMHEVNAYNGSFIRPLYFDFPDDRRALTIDNQFMLGKQILVSPVTESSQTEQQVYLPRGVSWYNFWTGKSVIGGQLIKCPVPIDQIPIFIKAGTIMPWGPEVQYAEAKKWDSLEIHIYPGADGNFTLYEDELNNYHYEKGAFTEVNFHWNDKTHVVTIDQRKGSFQGMLKKRVFKFVLINESLYPASHTERSVQWDGARKMLQLQ